MPPDEESRLEWAKHYGDATTFYKSIIVACATLHFYYTVTHFGEEVEYIWLRKWTTGKIMYLLTRYLGTFFLICSIIGVNVYAWNDPWIFSDTFTYGNQTLKNFIPTCFHGELFSGLGPMIILVAEVILQMRVYALYGRDKRLLVFFILLTVSLFGFNILQMSNLFLNIEENRCGLFGGCFNKRSMPRRALIVHTRLSRYACLEALPISGIGWAVTAFTEFLLFLLVVIRARKRLFKRRDQATTHDIRTLMAKDSLSYFAALFTICLFGATTRFISEHVVFSYSTLVLLVERNSYETIAITIMTILAPRLITNLREEVYGPSEITESQLTWNADVSEYISSEGVVADSNGADVGAIASSERDRS